MHGPTRAFGLALFIKRFGNSESVGVDFDDRVQTDSFLLFTGGAAAVIVDFTDSTKVCFSQRMSGNFAGGHAICRHPLRHDDRFDLRRAATVDGKRDRLIALIGDSGSQTAMLQRSVPLRETYGIRLLTMGRQPRPVNRQTLSIVVGGREYGPLPQHLAGLAADVELQGDTINVYYNRELQARFTREGEPLPLHEDEVLSAEVLSAE